jgi:hypothetical protein
LYCGGMTASRTYIAISILIALFAGSFAVPGVASAAYTWGGHTFATEAAMQDYIREYWVVYRELHGISRVSTQQVPSAPSTRTTTSASRDTTKLRITTSRAEDVTEDEARLLGRISFRDSDRVRIWFDYGTSRSRLTQRTETETLYEGSFGGRYFDREVRNLAQDTKYYYRAAGINENGVVRYGDIESFRTEADPRDESAEINVSTRYPSHVDEDRAVLEATVVLEESPYGYVWFEYSDEEDDLYEDTKRELVRPGDDRSYSVPVRRLDDETYYYVRVVGVDAYGTKNYGRTYKFKTKRDIEDEQPKVTTGRVSDIGLYSATIEGSVDMNDFRDATVFFVYGEDREEIRDITKDYSRYNRIKERGDDLQKVRVDYDLDRFDEYTLEIDDLDLDTRHYYAIGIEYEDEDDDETLKLGTIRTFTTKDIR